MNWVIVDVGSGLRYKEKELPKEIEPARRYPEYRCSFGNWHWH